MPSHDLIIRRGRVVFPAEVRPADIAISGGRISQVGEVEGDAETEIDASGLTLFPAAIDTQVHFREPGMEHKEDLRSGMRAAAMGGVGTIFEMPNTSPPTIDPDALADKVRRAKGRATTDFAFFAGATGGNALDLEQMESQVGCCGVKIFMGSSTGTLLVEKEKSLRTILKSGGHKRVAAHCEDEQRLRERKHLRGDDPALHPVWRDPVAAQMATERLIALSEETDRPIHILHISTQNELPIIQAAKRRGVKVTCEATPQHLTFTANDYEEHGTLIQMNPPIREPLHRDAIRDAVRSGLIDVIGSDHAPHTYREKQKPYPQSPSGIPGVQTLMFVMLEWAKTGEVSFTDVARLTAGRPAQIYGIQGKGSIAPGMDADIAFFDLDAETEVTGRWLKSRAGWSPWEGHTFPLRLEHTLLRGEFTVREGELTGAMPGRPARFIKG